MRFPGVFESLEPEIGIEQGPYDLRSPQSSSDLSQRLIDSLEPESGLEYG